MSHRIHKKNLIISYKNLSEDLRELFKDTYPDGYTDYLQKSIKPNGEPIFVVPLETEDTMYMVKFNVQIDSGMVEEDLDKDLYSCIGVPLQYPQYLFFKINLFGSVPSVLAPM